MGSTTVVGPSAPRPASRIADFTWALATGSSYVDAVERPALDDERRMAVRRLDGRAHPAQRLGDALHRAPGKGGVAGELEAPAVAGQEAGEEAHQRARVAAVDRAAGRTQAAEADAVDDELVRALLVDLYAERAHRLHRGPGVGRAAEAADPALALGDGGYEHRPVRHRFVAGNGQVADDGTRWLDDARHGASVGV